jgi:hypothetical protein
MPNWLEFKTSAALGSFFGWVVTPRLAELDGVRSKVRLSYKMDLRWLAGNSVAYSGGNCSLE